MKVCLYTNVVSPHQLPLARELVKRLGEHEFRYVYSQDEDRDHASLKFGCEENGMCGWILKDSDADAQAWLDGSDVLLCGLRAFGLFERRAAKGLKNLYMSETWFKPPLGYFRLLHPRYFGYVRKLVGMARRGALTILPIGVHAQRGFARVGVSERAMMLWGYFVEPGHPELRKSSESGRLLKVMWCGRRLALKHVEDIEAAVAHLSRSNVSSITLDIYSNLTLTQVREEMRQHDVFVFASNAYDGWGAVVSEALEEGMIVLGTNQAGASATILPPWQRFDCGDVKRLAELLEAVARDRRQNPEGKRWLCEIGEWTASHAADKLLGL